MRLLLNLNNIMKKILLLVATLTLISCNYKLEKVPIKIEPVKNDSTEVKAYKVDSIIKAIDERTKRINYISSELPRFWKKQDDGNFTQEDKKRHDELIKELKFILADSSQYKAFKKWNR